MARIKGVFLNSANYEPQIAAPFDARQRVEYRRDLIDPTCWTSSNGARYIYNGMIVVVCKDTPANNGVYILNDVTIFNTYEGWYKLANEEQIENLQRQIDNMQIGDGSVDLDSESELPAEGTEGLTYYIKENFSIQRWDAASKSYVSYGGHSDSLDIQLIYGGNADGNS